MTERWLPVAGYEGFYEVSDFGRVRSITRLTTRGAMKGRVLKPIPIGDGYLSVQLSRLGIISRCYLHRLVLETFVGPCPKGMEGCHDPDPTRTNCRLNNLRWDTRKNNHDDKRSHGSMPLGESHHGAKLTDGMVREMRQMRELTGQSYRALAECFAVTTMTAYRACTGQSWSHL